MTVFILIGACYLKYKELNGEEVDVKKEVNKFWSRLKSAFNGSSNEELTFTPISTSYDDEEKTAMTDDIEFDPNDIVKETMRKSKRQSQEEDEFDEEVKVEFDRDDENYPAHEMKDIRNPKDAKKEAYGTL